MRLLKSKTKSCYCNDSELELLSAIIDSGFFGKPELTDHASPIRSVQPNKVEERFSDETFESILERFKINKMNFEQGLSLEKIKHALDYMVTKSEEDAKQIEIYVDELIICYSTLLLLNKKREEAIDVLERGKEICEQLKFRHGLIRIELM